MKVDVRLCGCVLLLLVASRVVDFCLLREVFCLGRVSVLACVLALRLALSVRLCGPCCHWCKFCLTCAFC